MRNILSFLGKIYDKRRDQGKRYKLKSILALVIIGYMSGCNSLARICLLGKRLKKTDRIKLGFTGDQMPSHPTITEIMRKLDISEFEEMLGLIVKSYIGEEFTQISIDGKSINSTSNNKEGILHLLSAYLPEVGGVLSQIRSVPAGGEIRAAETVLSKLNIENKVITGDAMFAQEMLCHQIVSSSNDYIFKVKGNKKRIIGDIHEGFASCKDKNLDIAMYESPVQKAHGRIESRIIEALPVARKYFGGWANDTIQQFARITRKCFNIKKQKHHEEVHYIVSSIPKERISPKKLLDFTVSHWQIENNLHRTRDTNFKEDICNIACYKSQQANAALRNLAIFLLAKIHSSITAAIDLVAHNIKIAIPWLFRRT